MLLHYNSTIFHYFSGLMDVSGRHSTTCGVFVIYFLDFNDEYVEKLHKTEIVKKTYSVMETVTHFVCTVSRNKIKKCFNSITVLTTIALICIA